MAEIIRLGKQDHPNLAEQYSVGTIEEPFEVSDVQRMKMLVDPNGERKSFLLGFSGWLASMMDRCNFTPEEVRACSDRVTAEELEEALYTAKDPTEFVLMLSKHYWISVFSVSMLYKDKHSMTIPESKKQN